MLNLTDNEKEILRTVHLYVEGKGVGLSGHHMMQLFAKIDKERQQLRAIVDQYHVMKLDNRPGVTEELERRIAEWINAEF